MELALQVVGLKMTGKIEDAKDVAMRIVGSAGEETTSQTPDNSSMVQLATTSPASTREILPLLLNRGRNTENFETLIVNFLALLDTPLDKVALNPIKTANAISHASATTGQTLLHYATFLGLESLTRFLVHHFVDLDARDRSGYTALHFSALSGSVNCAQILLEAGADREIVNALGKTAAEIAQANVLDILKASKATYSDSEDDHCSEEEEEAVWGDGEEDAALQIPRRALKRLSRRSSKRGAALDAGKLSYTNSPSVSNAMMPSASDETQSCPPEIPREKGGDDVNDAKQTAWLREVLQRTLAQLHAPQGIISNIPQLPLPDLRNVPWNSLPQIPIVFPIFVPMPGWPSFLQSHNSENRDQNEDAKKGMSAGALRTAQELRTMLEKWVAMAAATATNQQQGQTQQLDNIPPPKYTPRVGTECAVENAPEASSSNSVVTENQVDDQDVPHPTTPSEIRPLDYRRVQLTDQEVNAYTYAPSIKQTRKLQKKRKLFF